MARGERDEAIRQIEDRQYAAELLDNRRRRCG